MMMMISDVDNDEHLSWFSNHGGLEAHVLGQVLPTL